MDRLDSTREELVTICANRTEQVRQVMIDKQKLIDLLRRLHLNEEDRRSIDAVLKDMPKATDWKLVTLAGGGQAILVGQIATIARPRGKSKIVMVQYKGLAIVSDLVTLPVTAPLLPNMPFAQK
jgi:hypothetical protein